MNKNADNNQAENIHIDTHNSDSVASNKIMYFYRVLATEIYRLNMFACSQRNEIKKMNRKNGLAAAFKSHIKRFRQ